MTAKSEQSGEKIEVSKAFSKKEKEAMRILWDIDIKPNLDEWDQWHPDLVEALHSLVRKVLGKRK